MIFAKIDVSFPHHYRLLDVRRECVREPLRRRMKSGRPRTDPCAQIARAAALGVWTAVLCYSRDHMLDGFCPLTGINNFAVDEVIDELVRQGLLARVERAGREGVVIVNYAKHNETKADIDRRLTSDRARKSAPRAARDPVDSDRIPPGFQTDSERVPGEVRSDSGPRPLRRLQARSDENPASESE